MTLIKSISGIRGTIGGEPGLNLTPVDIVNFISAYSKVLLEKFNSPKVIIGRDARISGPLVSNLVSNTLISCGIDVIDLELSTTPTVEMAVIFDKAQGGIIITASHNPEEWNALKFLNEKGEFISSETGELILKKIENQDFHFTDVNSLGRISTGKGYIEKHIQAILNLDLVNAPLIRSKKFTIVVDCINSSGAISVIPLLKELGCEVVAINEIPNGKFNHNPEPLPDNLKDLSSKVLKENADLGIVVDPDVDRLAFVCEDGDFFGEEYTLVAISDYILSKTPGTTVSNLSSTIALKELTNDYGQAYFSAEVGELNVVRKMKEEGAIIGGEGNGGIIYPELHYGRDALVGIALMLTFMAELEKSVSIIRKRYPFYNISKNKIQLTPNIDVDKILEKLEEKYINHDLDTRDGLKIYIDNDWIHLRKSNTEPIIRIYTESSSIAVSNNLAKKIKSDIMSIIK